MSIFQKNQEILKNFINTEKYKFKKLNKNLKKIQ